MVMCLNHFTTNPFRTRDNPRNINESVIKMKYYGGFLFKLEEKWNCPEKGSRKKKPAHEINATSTISQNIFDE